MRCEHAFGGHARPSPRFPHRLRGALLPSLLLAALHAPPAQALPLSLGPDTLSFQTSGQGMWGTGAASLPASVSHSYGWDVSQDFGGITGGLTHVDAVQVPIWHPPVYHDHGHWHKHKTLGVPWWHWHSRGEWHAGWTEWKTIVPAFDLDTRTGLAATVASSGEVGLRSSLGFDGGSVDASLGFEAGLQLPDDPLAPGQPVDLAPSASLAQGSLKTRFPTLTGKVEAWLRARAEASVQACLIGAGCTGTEGTLFDLDQTLPILEINTPETGPDQARLFGIPFGVDLTRMNIYLDATTAGPVLTLPGMPRPPGVGVNLAQLTLDYPDLPLTGGVVGDALVASGGFEDMVDLQLDLDALAGMSLGGVASLGRLTFRGDLLDVNYGPTVDLQQDFRLQPTLMVDLDFSEPLLVEEAGGWRPASSWSGPFTALPRLALPDPGMEVTVDSRFWVDAALSNATQLGFDLTLGLDILKGSVELGPITVDATLKHEQLDRRTLAWKTVFDQRFPLGGFQPVQGPSFVLRSAGAGMPRPRALGGPTDPPAGVPEPGALLLWLAGLVAAGAALRPR